MQKKWMRIVTSIIVIGLTGCVETPLLNLDSESRMKVREEVKTYNIEELQNMKYRQLAPIEGIACSPYVSAKSDVKKEDALDELRYRSKHLGGSGIVNVMCGEPVECLQCSNCGYKLTCNAMAIRVEPMGHGPAIAAPQAIEPVQGSEQLKNIESNKMDTVRFQDVELLQAGVVKIIAKSPGGTPKTGAGFIVRLDREVAHIVTAAHVVAGDPHPQVEFFTKRNASVSAEVSPGAEGGDEVRGLALLVVKGKDNIPAGLTQLSLASGLHITAGQDIVLIGFPVGAGPWAVIKGNVASRQGRDIYFSPTVGEGNSGGPIIQNGKVVGLVGAGGQLIGQGVTARSIEDYIEGFGVTPSKASENKPSQSRTIHIQEKLSKGDELVPLVFYKSNTVDLKQVRPDSVKLAAFNPQTVLESSKAGRKALDSLKEQVAARQRVLDAEEQELRHLEGQLNQGNTPLRQEFAQKLEKYKSKAKEFNADLEDKQRTLVELNTARMELVVRRVAERDHWDVVLDNFESANKEAKELVQPEILQLLRSGLPDITRVIIEEFDQLYK
jgi:outer membrane protein